mgnify:CR=1 FL=1
MAFVWSPTHLVACLVPGPWPLAGPPAVVSADGNRVCYVPLLFDETALFPESARSGLAAASMRVVQTNDKPGRTKRPAPST